MEPEDIPAEYQDRAAADPALALQAALGARRRPIAVVMQEHEVGSLYYGKSCNPYQYMQLVLAKLKDAGAPVEGVIHLKLAYGKVAVARQQPGEMFIRYVWLPDEYVAAIASAVRN